MVENRRLAVNALQARRQPFRRHRRRGDPISDQSREPAARVEFEGAYCAHVDLGVNVLGMLS